MESINEVVEQTTEEVTVESTPHLSKAERKALRRAERAAQAAQATGVVEADAAGVVLEAVEQESVSTEPTVSYADMGKTRAEALSSNDDAIAAGQGSVREDLLKVLEGPQASWSTYTEGFKTVLDARSKAGLPVMSLTVIRSNASRIINAAKKDLPGTVEKLSNTGLRWNQLLKSLPKKQGIGAPSKVEQGGKGETEVSIENEINVGTLLQIIGAAAARMEFIGIEKKAPFAHYIGTSIKDMLVVCQSDFHAAIKALGETNPAPRYEDIMIAIGLAPRKDVGTEQLQAAARQVA